MTKTATIFIGAGKFATKILDNLLKADFLEIQAVITQPDKQSGRKKQLTPPPVKKFLQNSVNDIPKDIPLLQPEKLGTESEEILNMYKPELIIVADYGQMIPANIIDYPKFKCLNVHGSLLPKYRGAVPVAMAILNGDKTTGVSIPIMTYKLDDGAVISSKSENILPTDTTYTLRIRLADIANVMINEVIPQWISGKIEPDTQDESQASFTWQSDIAKEKAQIKLDTPFIQAERMIRAFSPWPVAWIKLMFGGKEKRLKIFKSEISERQNKEEDIYKAGMIFKENKKLFLMLRNGVLELKEIQLEGKNIIGGSDGLFLDKAAMIE